ncbi:hypothetical protein ACTM4R_24335 [Citrobacter freundii]
MSYIQTLSGKKFNYLTATIDDNSLTMMFNQLLNSARQGASR